MRRRTALAALCTTLAGVAGCGARDGQPTATTEETASRSATTTSTATSTESSAPTATTTPTGTAVATTTGGVPVHGLGETFVVTDSPSIEYTFHRFATANSLGPIGRAPDQGVFLVAECTLENRGGQRTTVPVESILLRGGVRLFARQDDTDAGSADDRVDLPPLTDETLFPGTPVRGVLVFDVPTDRTNDYYLQITPPEADTPEHRVAVGSVGDLPRL